MSSKKIRITIIITLLGIIGFLVIAGIVYTNISTQKKLNGDSQANNSESSTPTLTLTPTSALTTNPTSQIIITNSPISSQVPTVTKYKNGNFTSNQPYFVEGTNEAINVTFTISNDTITGLKNTYVTNDSESKKYQDAFQSQISSKVVGKKLNDLNNLSRVGGASFTTRAFNIAITQIKAAAIN